MEDTKQDDGAGLSGSGVQRVVGRPVPERDGPVATLVQPKLPRVRFMERTPDEAYRPCNGTEGEFFMAAWCENCARDRVLNGTAADCTSGGTEEDWCEILGRSFSRSAQCNRTRTKRRG